MRTDNGHWTKIGLTNYGVVLPADSKDWHRTSGRETCTGRAEATVSLVEPL